MLGPYILKLQKAFFILLLVFQAPQYTLIKWDPR